MANKNKTKLLTATLAIATATAGQVSASDVVISELNWPSAKATAYIIKAVAEQELELEVDVSPASTPVIFKAMDLGRGDIDVHPEVWLPNMDAQVKKYVDGKKSVSISGRPYEVKQGYCVSRETAETYGIKSVYDLADPENAKLFDTDGDGKGEVWIGGAGWITTAMEKVRARDYGFGEFFELQVLDESLAMSKLGAAVKKKEPVVTYCYEPHHMFKLHDLVLLEEPAYDESKWTMVTPSDDPDWYNKSSISVAWPPVTLHMGWSNSLNDKQPEFTRLLANIQLTTEDVTQWIYAIVIDKKDARDYAEEWVRINPERIQSWLGY